ncbi:hypothetical protein [Achromobacter insolitus]|uniref:hypothetical protein n=1 Tax=Achromobacter insolitus TaxID=217204 RepID=UPI0028AEC124|nr:hypothetical protein [Achromobacter insolitus]
MALAALEIYSESGGLIVDSRNVNYFLRHKGVLYRTTEQYGTITLPCSSPVVFLRPLGGGATACLLVAQNGGDYTFRFAGDVEYYIFDKPWQTGGALDIFSEDGRHIFMSGFHPLNIVGSATIGPYWTASRNAHLDGTLWAGLPASKYAVNQSFIRQGYNCMPEAGGGWSAFLYPEKFYAHPQGFVAAFPDPGVKFFGWAPIYSNTFFSYAETCMFSVIDVSGLL